jgi:DNA-binding transcriptional LysR family regulator
VLCASPDYETDRGTPRERADLAEHECLTVTGTQHWDFLVPPGKTVRQRVSGRFTASSPEAIREACLGGTGIAMLSEWSVVDDIAWGRLVRIDLHDGEPDSLDIWAVYPSSRLLPMKTRLFIALLEKRLALS